MTLRIALLALLSALGAGCSCSTTHERLDAAVGNDAWVADDAFVVPDAAVEPDAFVVPDAAVEPDAFVDVDAFVPSDAGPSDGGVSIDGATCDFVGSFRETHAGFVTTLDADGTWQTVDPTGSMVSGSYSRAGDTITFTNTSGCSGTYHFVGSGCDAFTLVFISSDCGATGSDLSYARVP